MKLVTALLFFSWLLGSSICAADAESVKVGGITIQIPRPEGFVRYEGIDTRLDAALGTAVPAINRLLMVLAPTAAAKNAAAGKFGNLERYMNVQAIRAVENLEATRERFRLVAGDLEKFAISGANVDELVGKINNTHRAEWERAHMSIGQTTTLGVYEKTPSSIDFGMMSKIAAEGDDAVTIVGASSCLLIRKRLLLLAVYAKFETPDDVAWTRKTLKAWRESIISNSPD